MSQGNRPKPTTEQKEEALSLLEAGTPKEEVAKKLGLTRSQVGGLIGAFRRAGHLKNYQVSQQDFVNRNHPAAKRTPHRRQPLPAQQGADDGFEWQAAGGTGDGFGAPEITYEVERILPAEHGGLLGRHPAPFTKEDVGRIYGGNSRYRMTKFTPGQPALKTEFDVSATFGPPRTPARFQDPRTRGPQDPAARAEAARLAAEQGHPSGAPSWAREHLSGDRGMGGVITNLVDKLTAGKEGGDNSIVQQLLRNQDSADKAAATQAAAQRADEKAREDARQKEADRIRGAAETEREKAHGREIANINAMAAARQGWEDKVRGVISELDKKRLDLLDDRHKLREKELKDEITKSREEMRGVQASVKEELAEQEKRRNKEYDLREKMLDQKGEHEMERIKLLKQIHAGDSTSLIVDALKDLGTRAETTIGKLVKVREMELKAGGRVPLGEGQDEEVDGNISPGNVATAQTPDAAPAGAGNGHGRPGAATAAGGASDMKAVLNKILGSPLFQDIIDQWKDHIEVGNDPSMFANMYLEWMRDPRDEATDTRQACSTFANTMSAKKWPAMLAIIRPHLKGKPASLAILETPEAENFYMGFRFIVCEHIRDYYREYMAARGGTQPAAAAAPTPPDTPAAPKRKPARRKAEGEPAS